MINHNRASRHVRVSVGAIVALSTFGCTGAPMVPEAIATASIEAWLPGSEVHIVGSGARDDGVLVDARVSGEALRFRFRPEGGGWTLEGMVVGERALDYAATRAAWLDIVREPQEVTLAQLAAGERPQAPLEVVIGGLRVVALGAARMELESVADPELGRLVVNGRHFDNLPVQEGISVAVQLQGITRDGDVWVPERATIPNELLVELQPIDVTLLALLKLRLPTQVVPVPYAIPGMAHDHG